MADSKEYVAGSSSLVLGADAYTLSTDLDDREYVMGMNVVCRGGIVQTRPGTRSLFCLPSGNFQGATLFTPDNGTAQLVAAVDGKIYASAAPFTSYRRLWNLQFSPTSKYLAWAVTLKSTDYDNEGNLITLDNPYSILIMQDGVTRAAYWDGGTSGHLNPATPTDVTDIVPGYSETPIGLWMIWSGNRLWVSRGNQIFASDIGNPLKFTETLYLNEGRAFCLSGPCTGMIEVPSDSAGAKGFIAFTDTNGTLFQSYIQDRTLWLSQPLFQNTILPNIGCVAPRSLVTQYGLNWWFGPRGFTNINAALRQNITSRVDYQDNQMFTSKAYLGPDLSSICASFYENYTMVSVPSGDVKNRHTWVLDQAPMEGNVNAWTGFWTGWRPIEWCRGLVNGSERVFFGSIDYDGNNRIWEAMLPERTDNGCAITCYLQTREHAAGNLDLKAYDWSKFFLSQIYGEVDLDVYVASTKGGFQKQKTYHIVANKGQIFSDVEYSEVGPLMIGNRVQSRTIRTPANPEDSECNACGVESNTQVLNDYAFSHLLVWSGQMGVRAYQCHYREVPERNDGDCEEPEVGPRTLNAAGCGGLELLVDGDPFEMFTSYAEGMTQTRYGTDIYIRRTATSAISEDNARAMAECAVEQIIAQLKDTNIAPGVYDSTAAEIGNGTYVVVNSARGTGGYVSMSCASASGEATLCGFSEWLPSTPPKKYLTLTSSGGIKQCASLNTSLCDGATRTVSFFSRDGVLQYDPSDCSVNTVTKDQLEDVFSDCTPDPTTPVATYPLLQRTTTPIANRTKTFDGDSYFELCDETCELNGLDSLRNFGSITQTLTNEDTESDAIARASTTPGTSCTAYRESRGADDFTFLFQDVEFTITCTGLINGLHYTVTAEVLEENYGGGSPVITTRTYNFYPSGSSHVITDVLTPSSGKQLTVSNVTINA